MKPTVPRLFEQPFWLAVFQLLVVNVSVMFFTAEVSGQTAMREEIYGAAVYAIPAEAWSSVIFAHGSLTLIGLVVQGRVGAFMCLIGSLVGLAVYSLFYILSSRAEIGGALAFFAVGMFCPIHALILIVSFQELFRDPDIEVTEDG